MIGFKGFGYQQKFTQCPIIDVLLQSSSKLVHIRMVWNVDDDLSLTNLQVPCYLCTAKLAQKTNNLEPKSITCPLQI